MAELELNLLYQDANFIVVNKEHDLIINSLDCKRRSLQKQLCSQFSVPQRNAHLKFGFYFPHRLDYPTSGVICIALNKTACAEASIAFHDRKSKKYYLALVRGHLSQRLLQVEVPIGEIECTNSSDPPPPHKMVGNGKKSKKAISRILTLDRGLYSSYPATKVLLKPVTGRRHQLRVHCSLLGHTIVGDYTYSNKKDVEPPRMFLHAYRLMLPNKLKNLDVRTDDPFDTKFVKEWISVEKLNDLNEEAMHLMDDEISDYNIIH